MIGNIRKFSLLKQWKNTRISILKYSSTIQKSGIYCYLSIHDDIGVVNLAHPGKSNILSQELANEVADMFGEIERNPKLIGGILASRKPKSFGSGIDINILSQYSTEDDGYQLSKFSHDFMNKIKRIKKPTVAAIMGACVGGNLEASLSCDYRIAVRGKSTLIFPEVLIGFLTGGGGNYMLPKLIGLPNALDMLLTGKTINAEKAKSLGLVDSLVDSLGPGLEDSDERTLDYLLEVAIDTTRKLAKKEIKINREPRGFINKSIKKIMDTKYAKNYICDQALKKVKKQTRGLYPAPLKIIHVVREGAINGELASNEAEANALGQLLQAKESKGLVNLFHGQRNCKKNKFGKSEKRVTTIGVVGAGLMGTGIANVSLSNGFTTIIRDLNDKVLAKSEAGIQKAIEQSVKRKRITQIEGEKSLAKLTSTKSLEIFSKADIVVEAIFEDMDLKHRILHEVEEVIPEHCIFATNTSALQITNIAKASKRPEKVVGMHYFSPVEKMQLVEIVRTDLTSKQTLQTAVDVALRQRKIPIVVKDGPGFFTSRVITALTSEAFRLILEGVNPERIDNLAMDLGFPIGPVVLADEVGIDVGYHVYKGFVEVFGDRYAAVPLNFGDDVVRAGFLGRKCGIGYYIYHKHSNKKTVNQELLKLLEKHKMEAKMPITDDSIKFRILSRFLNEAILCLQEGIISNPQEGDIGAVFGLGFPPFTGGPFFYIDSFGADKIVARMREIENAYGITFTPCQMLVDHANNPSEKRFYNN